MKDLWSFVALGLNAALLLTFVVIAIGQGLRTPPGLISLLMATAPASSVVALSLRPSKST